MRLRRVRRPFSKCYSLNGLTTFAVRLTEYYSVSNTLSVSSPAYICSSNRFSLINASDPIAIYSISFRCTGSNQLISALSCAERHWGSRTELKELDEKRSWGALIQTCWLGVYTKAAWRQRGFRRHFFKVNLYISKSYAAKERERATLNLESVKLFVNLTMPLLSAKKLSKRLSPEETNHFQLSALSLFRFPNSDRIEFGQFLMPTDGEQDSCYKSGVRRLNGT